MVAQKSKIDMFIQEFRAYSGSAGGVNGSAAGNGNTAHQGAKGNTEPPAALSVALGKPDSNGVQQGLTKS